MLTALQGTVIFRADCPISQFSGMLGMLAGNYVEFIDCGNNATSCY
jgi:hypothetical protein